MVFYRVWGMGLRPMVAKRYCPRIVGFRFLPEINSCLFVATLVACDHVLLLIDGCWEAPCGLGEALFCATNKNSY